MADQGTALRSACVRLLSHASPDDSDTEDITLLRSYGLETTAEGARVGNLWTQRHIDNVVPLLLALVTTTADAGRVGPNAEADSSHQEESSKAPYAYHATVRAAALRCLGNAFVQRNSIDAAQRHISFGSVRVASDILRTLDDEDVRREACRILNNVAACVADTASGYLDTHTEIFLEPKAHIVLISELLTLGKPSCQQQVVAMAVGALMHMCESEPMRDHLRKAGAIEALEPIVQCDDPKLRYVRATIAASILAGSDENHHVSINIIRRIIEALKAAVTKQPFPKGSNTFNKPTTVLRGVAMLAGNEDNKRHLLECHAIELLFEIVEETVKRGHKTELPRLALEALWSICFLPEAAQCVRSNTSWMSLLRAEATSSENLSDSAQGILWLLEGKDTSANAANLSGANKRSGVQQGPTVMLSYSWAQQDLVLQIYQALKAADIHVWIDVENMRTNTLEAMARAVEEADVICMCISRQYKESANCRTEAEYAYTLKKKIVPIKVQQQFRPGGWLGALMGARLWYDVSDPTTLAARVQAIVKEVRGDLPGGDKSSTAGSTEIKGGQSRPSLSGGSACSRDAKGFVCGKWTQDELCRWLVSNKLPEAAAAIRKTDLDGEAMAALLREDGSSMAQSANFLSSHYKKLTPGLCLRMLARLSKAE